MIRESSDAKQDKEKALMNVVNNQMKLFQNDIKKLEFKNIGIPSKWGRQIQIVNGSRSI